MPVSSCPLKSNPHVRYSVQASGLHGRGNCRRPAGSMRDRLVQQLDSLKPNVDRATAGLSQALGNEGLLPDDYRALRSVREQRDRARDKYERLRQEYLKSERDWQEAEKQKHEPHPK